MWQSALQTYVLQDENFAEKINAPMVTLHFPDIQRQKSLKISARSSQRPDLNRQPSHYECDALPIEATLATNGCRLSSSWHERQDGQVAKKVRPGPPSEPRP